MESGIPTISGKTPVRPWSDPVNHCSSITNTRHPKECLSHRQQVTWLKRQHGPWWMVGHAWTTWTCCNFRGCLTVWGKLPFRSITLNQIVGDYTFLKFHFHLNKNAVLFMKGRPSTRLNIRIFENKRHQFWSRLLTLHDLHFDLTLSCYFLSPRQQVQHRLRWKLATRRQ